ncbi:MAG: nitroreductase family protein [Candidatus Binataceae bacterium]
MDVIEAIRTRRSIGRVEGELTREQISELIELATCAPNHHLTEPWRFTILTGAAREHLGRIWAERAAAQSDPAMREKLLANEAKKPLRAPALVVVSTRTDPNPIVAEEDFAATSAAVQNLLLAAHCRGLGAMWRTGKIVHDGEVKKFLGLDADDRIVAMVYLGRTAMVEPEAAPRGVDSVTRWIDGA